MDRPGSEPEAGSPGAPEPRLVRFENCEVDLDRGEIRRDGRFVKLEPLPTRLLTVLIERAGHVVLRSELLRMAWPEGTRGTERGLNTAVRQVRGALGDSAERPRFVETVPRRGYRFAAELHAGPAGDLSTRAAPPSRRQGLERRLRWSAGTVLAAAAVSAVGLVVARSAPIRIAVLPLDVWTLSPGPSGVTALEPGAPGAAEPGAVLASAFEEDLISTLALPAPDRLQAIARTSSSRYRDSNKTAGEIAAELDVQYLVEGSLTTSPDGYRLVARLVRTEDAAEVWSQSYAVREMRELESLKWELADRIVDTVLGSAPPFRGAAEAETTGDARFPFLVGRHLLSSGLADRSRSVPYLEEAVRLDPDFAPARALLAEALLMTDRVVEAEPHARIARRLDPDLPDALVAHGLVEMLLHGDQRAAEDALRRAVRRSGGAPYTMHQLAYHLLVRGKTAEAIEWMRRAASLDPVSAATVGDLGYFFYFAGRYDEAIEWCERAHELDPDAGWPLGCLFNTATAMGDTNAAVRWARAIIVASGHVEPDDADPVARLRRLRVSSAIEAVETDRTSHYWLALAYADLGELEAAAEALEKAADELSLALLSATVEPRLAPLRGTEAYARLIERLRLGT